MKDTLTLIHDSINTIQDMSEFKQYINKNQTSFGSALSRFTPEIVTEDDIQTVDTMVGQLAFSTLGLSIHRLNSPNVSPELNKKELIKSLISLGVDPSQDDIKMLEEAVEELGPLEQLLL